MARINKNGNVDGRSHDGMRAETRAARSQSMRNRHQRVQQLEEALRDIRAVAQYRIEHGEDTIGMRSLRDRAAQALDGDH